MFQNNGGGAAYVTERLQHFQTSLSRYTPIRGELYVNLNQINLQLKYYIFIVCKFGYFACIESCDLLSHVIKKCKL
jgi:hypothetical protein